VWSSKDLALIIMFSVLNFVYTALIGQLAWLLTGIQGTNLLLIIGGVIINSFALLYFQGRRWRFAMYQILFAILVIPTYLLGVPFDIVARTPIVIVGVLSDIIFNSFYGFFKKHNRLMWWVIIDLLAFFLMTPFTSILVFSFIYAPTFVSGFINTVVPLIPVVIIESIIGAVIGYRIHLRVQELA
jgi:hypothetical protein